MERKIRVVQFGCGKMSIYTMRYAIEKGCEIVGAFDNNPLIVGKDIGEIIKTDNLGVKINDTRNGYAMLRDLHPDVCIVTTMSLMKDVAEALLACAELGINAITTCEEAFFPWNSSPALTRQIDELAKKTGCTITGTGYQDVAWGNLIATIAGTTHKITKIKGSSSYNVEDYGIALAKAHGAGLSLADFDKEIAAADNISEEERQALINRGAFLPSYMWNASAWICERLGLTIKTQVQKCVPKTADKDITSSTLQMTIPAGHATGMSAVVTTVTNEGIIIEAECIGKVYAPDEYDVNEWSVYGEPDTEVVVAKPATPELTCAAVVNRIPDVINARPGYVTTDQMPMCQYRSKKLNEYVQ